MSCLLGGWLLYRFVETPFMRLRDRHHPTNVHAPASTRPEPPATASLVGTRSLSDV